MNMKQEYGQVHRNSYRNCDTTDPKTLVTGLSLGDNFLIWTVTKRRMPVCGRYCLKLRSRDNGCSYNNNPNYDGKNDYFVLQGLEELGRTELVFSIAEECRYIRIRIITTTGTVWI